MNDTLRRCLRHECCNYFEASLRKLYCSNSCKQKVYRARHKMPLSEQPSFLTKRKCRYCGEKFIANNERHVFCKTSCRVSYHQLSIRTERKAV